MASERTQSLWDWLSLGMHSLHNLALTDSTQFTRLRLLQSILSPMVLAITECTQTLECWQLMKVPCLLMLGLTECTQFVYCWLLLNALSAVSTGSQ